MPFIVLALSLLIFSFGYLCFRHSHTVQVLIAFAMAGPPNDADPANSPYRMLVSTLLDVFRDDTRATAPNVHARFKLL